MRHQLSEATLITGKQIYLKFPSENDFEVIRNIWEDKDTMEDVGGICLLSKEKYSSWYKYHFETNVETNRYFLIYRNEDNVCVGEISFHQYNFESKKAMLNIKTKNEYRNLKYGYESLDLMLDYYFNKFGGLAIEDSIWYKNINGL